MLRRRRDDSEDLRTFIREILLRYDRGIAAMREENRRYFEQLDAKTDEIIAENRAQRRALLRILDRMEGNGGTASA